MKKINFCLIALLLLMGCQQQSNQKINEEALTSDNKELMALHGADQADRMAKDSIQPLINRDPQLVRERDAERRKRVYELLDANLVKTGKDFENAAMIFQHGLDTTASSMAVQLMKTATEMDSTVNKWLLAAAIDRDLMWRKKPQIYGTQYLVAADNSLELYQMDTTQISDQERIEHGVPVLSELLKQAEK
ncbi:MAG: DUF6624 domain-containing protein [Bacteroidota bacterium]